MNDLWVSKGYSGLRYHIGNVGEEEVSELFSRFDGHLCGHVVDGTDETARWVVETEISLVRLLENSRPLIGFCCFTALFAEKSESFLVV